MTGKKKKIDPPSRPNLGRHESGCRICSHPQRQEIEHDFISWKSPTKITDEYKLVNRSTVYRHGHAVGLFPKRARNVRAALERIIERADDVQVTAAAIVQAITTYARINTQGQLVEREEVSMNEFFDRMTVEELEAYAKDGTLPSWFPSVANATRDSGPEGNENG